MCQICNARKADRDIIRPLPGKDPNGTTGRMVMVCIWCKLAHLDAEKERGEKFFPVLHRAAVAKLPPWERAHMERLMEQHRAALFATKH